MTMRTFVFCGYTAVTAVACGGITTVQLGSDRYDMIDDMEDKNEFLIRQSGRSGGWVIYNDGTPGAMQWPSRDGNFAVVPVDRGASRYGLRTYGQGFNDSGHTSGGWASVNALLVASGTATDGGLGEYDARAYRGVRFWAKIGDASQPPRFGVADLQTDPKGHVCQGPNGDADCYNTFGVTVPLTTDWTLQKIDFSDLQQRPAWGTMFPSVDLGHVSMLFFLFSGPAPFDLWIDDIEFFW